MTFFCVIISFLDLNFVGAIVVVYSDVRRSCSSFHPMIYDLTKGLDACMSEDLVFARDRRGSYRASSIVFSETLLGCVLLVFQAKSRMEMG